MSYPLCHNARVMTKRVIKLTKNSILRLTNRPGF